MLSASLHGSAQMFYSCALIIKHFLGKSWVDENIFANNEGFLSANFRLLDLPHTTHRQIAILRVNKLAEMLYNFQFTEGFIYQLALLEQGQVETTFALLEIAMSIQCSGHLVRFRKESEIQGVKSHDLDVTLEDGRAICVEAKARIITEKPHRKTVRRCLLKASKQLPPSEMAAIIVRVPSDWAVRDFIVNTFDLEARKLFKKARNVQSIVAVTNKMTISPDGSEVVNPILSRDLLNDQLGSLLPFRLIKTYIMTNRWTWLSFLFGENQRPPEPLLDEIQKSINKYLDANGPNLG